MQQLKAYDARVRRRSSRTSQRTGSTRATRCSWSPSTRATTSPAASARRSRTATGSSTTTRTCTNLSDLPVEPDRRGRREHERRCLPAGRADVRHPLRRRADVLRQRPARPRPTRPCASSSATSASLTLARPVRRQRRAGRRCTLTAGARRPGRGEDAAHGQRRPEPDADVHDVRQPRLLLPDVEPVHAASPTLRARPGFAWNHGDIQEEIGNTWVGFVGPGVASNGVDSTTWTDHTNLRPTILALARAEGRLHRRRARARRRRSTHGAHAGRARTARRSPQLEQTRTSSSTRRSGSSRRPRSKASTTALESDVDRRRDVHVDRGLDREPDDAAGRARARRSGRR